DTVTRVKLHDDVGELALRTDEISRVGLPELELGEHLVGRVAALAGIPPDLPDPPQVLGRSEVDLQVVELAHHGRMEAEQPPDDAGDDRSACGHGDSFALPSLAGVGSSAKMLLFRMSCGSIVISSSRVSRPPRSNRRLA